MMAIAALVTTVIVAGLGSFLSTASGAVPSPGGAAAVQVPAAVPGAPFIDSVIAEGLGALVNWNPNPATDQVSGYTLTAG
jgi:hypothetical protein